MAKQLSMKHIAIDNKKYKEIIEFPVIAQGEEYSIKIHPYFAPTKIKQLVDNLIQFYQNSHKENLIVSDEEHDDLIGYFIIRTFTNIKMTTSKKAKTIYEEFKSSIDSTLFKIILETIPDESILDVQKRIFETIEANAKIETQLKKTKSEIDKLPLKNRDLLLNKKKQIPEV